MSIFSLVWNLFSSKNKEVKIICCGLDNSGKSTMINLLKPKKMQTQDITPTVGYSVEKFQKNNLSFTVFDMSGQTKFRNLWESFFTEAHGIIFVLDSADRMRMSIAKDELDNILTHKDFNKIPILIFANKQDLPHALSPAECSESLQLHMVKNTSWTIVPSNALKGVGVDDGIKWLSEEVMKRV